MRALVQLLVLALTACGDNTHAMTTDALLGCSTVFTGNFAETSSSAASCPMLTDSTATLAFTIPVAKLSASLAVSIQMPALVSGMVTSETSPAWTATASELVGDGGCVFRGGNAVTPSGDFVLELTALAPLAGSLSLDLAVLSLPSTDCGLVDTEHVVVTF
jgi:hypothetical protein